MTTATAEQASKELFLRYVDAAVSGKFDAFDEIFAPEYVTFPDLPPGPEGTKMLIGHLHRVFERFHVQVERIVAEGDWIAVHIVLCGVQREDFLGHPASGGALAMHEMQFLRVEGGRFVERRVVFDTLEGLRQLGANPTW